MFDLDPQKLMGAMDKVKSGLQMLDFNDDTKAKIENFIKGQGANVLNYGPVRSLLTEIANKKPDLSKLLDSVAQIKSKFPELAQKLENLLK